MKIGVLTSSRADFGIYTPLLKVLKTDPFFDLEIIAFGTHLSQEHGNTIKEIEEYQFPIIHRIVTPIKGNTPQEISSSIGKTTQLFSKFWAINKYDLVFVLGDRFEMFAAVSAASPFIVNIAHIHAGETTLGAIDNAYRHSISLFSSLLFVSNKEYKSRAQKICESSIPIHEVGALSIDNLKKVELYTKVEFLEMFQIDLNKETILSTFHPETVAYEKNIEYVNTLLETFEIVSKKYQVVLTMPNMDTMGNVIRQRIKEFQKKTTCLILIESFGMKGYLSCMKYCSFMLGNTSSGFVEASFFPTKVLNIGNRQDGRIRSKNMIDCPINTEAILEKIKQIESLDMDDSIQIYGDGSTAEKIVKIIKTNV